MNKKLRIAHLPASFLPTIGGAEIATHNIAWNQASSGHEVTVFTYGKDSKAFARENSKNLPYRMQSFAPKCIKPIEKLARYNINLQWVWEVQVAMFQRRYGFDVWHFNSLDYQSFFTLPVLRRQRVACIGTCRGGDIQRMPEVGYGRRLDPFFDHYFRKSIHEFTLVTAISDSVRQEYTDVDIPSDRIRSVPNGLNVNYIKSQEVDPVALRKEMDLPLDKSILISVGRNHPKKGFIYIPDIVKKLLSYRDDFLWIIVGRGTENIVEKAHEIGVAPFIRTIAEIGAGSRRDINRMPPSRLISLYKSSDLFVFPTLLETFGNVQLEAMAAGLPVITTDAPGARDLVQDGVNGLVSPVQDFEGMARNVHRVLASRQVRDELVSAGLEWVEKYHWEVIAEKYCDVYREAALRVKGRDYLKVSAGS